jgi:hypothetical protein
MDTHCRVLREHARLCGVVVSWVWPGRAGLIPSRGPFGGCGVGWVVVRVSGVVFVLWIVVVRVFCSM